MDSVIAKLDGTVYSILGQNDSPRVMIRGIRNARDIGFVNRVRADYACFVFDEKDDNGIAPEDALGLKKDISPAIRTAASFTDASLEYIAKTVKENHADIIVLCGSEDDEYTDSLRLLVRGLPIVKEVKPGSENDLPKPLFLSGDFTRDNIRAVIDAMHPDVVILDLPPEESDPDYERTYEIIREIRKAGTPFVD